MGQNHRRLILRWFIYHEWMHIHLGHNGQQARGLNRKCFENAKRCTDLNNPLGPRCRNSIRMVGSMEIIIYDKNGSHLSHRGQTTTDSGRLIVRCLEGNEHNPSTDSWSRLGMSKRSLGLGGLVYYCFTNEFCDRRVTSSPTYVSSEATTRLMNSMKETRLVDHRNNLKEGTALS